MPSILFSGLATILLIPMWRGYLACLGLLFPTLVFLRQKVRRWEEEAEEE